MPWTKQQIIEEAFDAAGLSSYIFNMKPEDYQSALRKLDTMMATWYARGILLPYPQSMDPADSDLDTDTNLPDWSVEAVYSNLALRISPAFGKTVSLELKMTAIDAFRDLQRKFSKPESMQFPETLPRGAGNNSRYINDRYFDPPYTIFQPWDKK